MPDLLSTYRPSLGGSEPDALLKQSHAAHSAVLMARRKIVEIDIHPRDYQGRDEDYKAELARRDELVAAIDQISDALGIAGWYVLQHTR